MGKPETTLRIDVVEVECVDAIADTTLLESLEHAGIQCHFNCRDGFCGACRTKLISGEVSYTLDPLAFIDDDEILPCCCKPVTDLKIDVPL